MAAPMILAYNLESQEKLHLRFLCGGLKIALYNVPPADYGQPLAALAGMRPRLESAPAVEGFSDAMLVMVRFNAEQFHALLDALRRNRLLANALKAVLTPTNGEWDSAKLHAELVREREAMRKKQ